MAGPTDRPRLRGRARAVAFLAWVIFLAVLGELTARAFWRLGFGMSFFDTRGAATMFYPELGSALRQVPSRRDSVVDVLLLGASTIKPDYGAIAAVLKERLALATRRRVRVFNMGVAAQTSLDSYYKYRALAGVGFDLVIVYDGFNEVRANNVPPELFRDDYSHFAFYQLINDILGDHRAWPLALPYTVRYLTRELGSWRAQQSGHPIRVPRNVGPDSVWSAFGGSIRTAGPFRHNTEAVLTMAAARGEPVVLMTFATYFAPAYSSSGFKARNLDYTTHLFPIELWGRPEYVAAGVVAHNAVIRELHAEWPAIGFVDMAGALPRERVYFNDVCHLTIAGSERFVDLLMPTVLAKLGITTP